MPSRTSTSRKHLGGRKSSAQRKRSDSLNRLIKQAVASTKSTGSNVVRGAAGLTGSALRSSINAVKNTASRTVSGTENSVADTVDFARSFSTDFVNALETVASGLIDGTNTLVDTTGRVSQHILTDIFDVKATHVFKGAGKLAKSLAENIGGVVRQVPLVGNATGYVVESLGGGVYHVIFSIGRVLGSTSRKFGNVVKKTSDLVVFTLSSGKDQIKDTTASINDILERIANTVALRKNRTLRQYGGDKRKRRNRSRSSKNKKRSSKANKTRRNKKSRRRSSKNRKH